jgi:predicted acetyltransferase
MTGELRLRAVGLDDEAVVRAAQEAMAAEGFPFALFLEPDEPWADYVTRLYRYSGGEDLPGRLVPSTFLLAELDGEVVGRTSIRHELNDFLRHEGGHIGYGVLAQHRRQGHATEILRQSLGIARGWGIDRVLITCDDDNVGSATIIERAGGVLEDVVDNESGTRTRRYWIG